MFEYNPAAIDASSSYDHLDDYLGTLEDKYNHQYFNLRKWLDENAHLVVTSFNQASYPLNDWKIFGFYHDQNIGLAQFKSLLISALNWLTNHPDVVSHQYLPQVLTEPNNPIINKWMNQQINQWLNHCQALVTDWLAYKRDPGQYQLNRMMSTLNGLRAIYGDSIDELLKQNHHN